MTENITQPSGRAETAILPDSVGLLRTIVDRSAVAMALIGRNDRLTYVNRPLCRLTGYDPDALSVMALCDLLHPEEREKGDGRENPSGDERRLLRKDGTVGHGLVIVSPMDETTGDMPFRAILQIVDIDQRKRAELAVAEKEWRWNQALVGAGQGVWDSDLATGQAWISPQLQVMLGIGPDEKDVRQGEWLARIHPDDHELTRALLADVLTGRSSALDTVFRVRRKDERWIWVRAQGRVTDRAGDRHASHLVGTVVDISREKEMEARLATATERLGVALDAGGIGIFEVDFPSGFRHWDARTHELHGVSAEDFDHTASGFDRLIHPDDVARVSRIRDAALRGSSHYQVDYRVPLASGEIRHIRVSVRLARGAEGAVERGIGACWDVTEDIERARHLHETVALLEAVIGGTPDLIFAKDRDGRYLLTNRAVEEVMDRSRAEIVGRNDTQIFGPETAQPFVDNDRRVMDGRAPRTAEERVLVGGVLRTYSVTKAPRFDENGEVVGVVGISRDVTDVKAAEAALRQSELRWQFALDGSGDGVWDWNMQTDEVFYSRQWKAMLGYDEAEIGSTLAEWSDRVHPEDLPKCWAIIDRHFRGETPDFAIEHRMRAKDGGWRWIYDRGKVVERAVDGTPLRSIGTHTDITARKASEAAILALNQRLQIVIEAAGAGVFELDFATSRFDWDEGMYRLYDLPEGDYDGTLEKWLTFIHPDDVPEILRRFGTAVEQTSVFSMEFRIRRQQSGELRHVSSLARVIRDEVGRPLRAVGMSLDISDHMKLAEALFEEKERLRITLYSIGDSVISTDAQARITFMNPIAEEMTGWSALEAAGRPLSEVFRIVDEVTGEAIPDPVETCLERLQPFYLNDGAVLVARDGERRGVRDSAAPVRTATGEVIGAVLVFQDVTRSRMLQQALEHSANHDNLTGLPNRVAFERALGEATEQARAGKRRHVLCFVDLDRFKIVNDGAGHAAGDALLREVAGLMRRACRSQDVAARLGGDEFALLLRGCSLEKGEAIARRLLRKLGELRFQWGERDYHIGASIGLTAIEQGAPRPDELMSQADIACYTAKTAGRNQIAIYGGDDSDALRNHREVQVAAGIRNAIEADRFRLYAQEVRILKGAKDGERHFEILLRMLDENGNIAEPSTFIPASERYDLMGNIDRWVIRTALRTYGTRLYEAGNVSVAINLSANSLNDPFLWPFVWEELGNSGLPPERLCFEITETAVVNNLSAATQFLSKARAAGCRVLLDDFGAGLSSFTYLRQFPVDGLKIDGGFIRQMAGSEIDRVIVESINAIGHRLGVITVAEHVETEETLRIVQSLGIDRAQGYAIGYPQPIEAIF